MCWDGWSISREGLPLAYIVGTALFYLYSQNFSGERSLELQN